MEAINAIELGNPEIYPSDDVLQGICGKTFSIYKALLELFQQNDMTYEWRYYRDGKAWLCKVQYKKRTIVWMSAWRGYIKATIYFPNQYIQDVYGLNINEKLIESIKKTKDVGKSKPVMFDMKTKSVLSDFTKVMQFKLIAK